MDSSIQGMGKGPGNLIAEQWLAHLDRTDTEAAARLHLGPALELADLLLSAIPEGTPPCRCPTWSWAATTSRSSAARTC